MAADNTYATGNFEKQGGAEWDIGNGTSNKGSLVVNAGGTVDMSGADANAVKLPSNAFNVLSHAAHNGAGAVTLTGAVIGDRVLAVFSAPTAGGALAARVVGTDFESTISVADQIQQLSATDLSAQTIVVFLSPK